MVGWRLSRSVGPVRRGDGIPPKKLTSFREQQQYQSHDAAHLIEDLVPRGCVEGENEWQGQDVEGDDHIPEPAKALKQEVCDDQREWEAKGQYPECAPPGHRTHDRP